jgi:hypothetical protein
MAAFKKFDPQAFLERERIAADGSSTLATLATLAAQPTETYFSNNDVSAAPLGQNERNNNHIQSPIPAKVAKVAKVERVGSAAPYSEFFGDLEGRCPDFIEPKRWQQVIEDGHRFLVQWGEQAEALGWTTQELFGLYPVPVKPHPSFQRLARYDSTGLIWLLHGRPVLKMTANSAAIRTASGGTVVYRKDNKPALGPLGDSLDDMGSAT